MAFDGQRIDEGLRQWIELADLMATRAEVGEFQKKVKWRNMVRMLSNEDPN